MLNGGVNVYNLEDHLIELSKLLSEVEKAQQVVEELKKPVDEKVSFLVNNMLGADELYKKIFASYVNLERSFCKNDSLKWVLSTSVKSFVGSSIEKLRALGSLDEIYSNNSQEIYRIIGELKNVEFSLFPVIPDLITKLFFDNFVEPFNFHSYSEEKRKEYYKALKGKPEKPYWVMCVDKNSIAEKSQISVVKKLEEMDFCNIDLYTACYMNKLYYHNSAFDYLHFIENVCLSSFISGCNDFYKIDCRKVHDEFATRMYIIQPEEAKGKERYFIKIFQ